MRAIESPSTLDDQQWLTYWVLYSFMTLFELSFYKILYWYVHVTQQIRLYIWTNTWKFNTISVA